MISRRAVMLFGLSVTPFAAVASLQYTFTELRLPGSDWLSAHSAADVSDSGWIVGLGTLPDRSGFYCWRWRDGQFEILPELPGVLGGRAEGVNERGDVGGWSYDGGYVPVRWMSGVVERLPYLPQLKPLAEVFDINEQGDLVGMQLGWQDDTHAVRWTNGSPEDLGDLSGGPYNAWGKAINDAGLCVGYAQGDSPRSHAALFNPPDILDLGVLNPSRSSSAYDINVHGEVCGDASIDATHTNPVLWRNGKLIDLGPPPIGTQAYGFALNDLTHIVGPCTGTNLYRTPFLWTLATGYQLVGSAFPGTWRNINPYALNNKGWIVGEAEKHMGGANYRWSGYLLKPLTLTFAPSALTVLWGKTVAGNSASLATVDGDAVRVCRFLVPNQNTDPIQVRVESDLPWEPMNLWFKATAKAATAGAFTWSLNLYNWQTGLYDPATNATAPLTLSNSSQETIAKGDISRYWRASDRKVWALLRVRPIGPTSTLSWCADFDQAVWEAVPLP